MPAGWHFADFAQRAGFCRTIYRQGNQRITLLRQHGRRRDNAKVLSWGRTRVVIAGAKHLSLRLGGRNDNDGFDGGGNHGRGGNRGIDLLRGAAITAFSCPGENAKARANGAKKKHSRRLMLTGGTFLRNLCYTARGSMAIGYAPRVRDSKTKPRGKNDYTIIGLGSG